MHRHALIAFVCLLVPVGAVQADNNITLSAVSGINVGTINVTGAITSDTGWMPGMITIAVWVDGGEVNYFQVSPKGGCNAWTYNTDVGPGCPPLSSGTTYNVTADVTFTASGQCPQSFRSPPTTAVAK